jgi:hypothetical protein
MARRREERCNTRGIFEAPNIMKLTKKVASITTAMLLTGSMIGSTADAHYYGGCKKNRCKRHVVAPYWGWINATARCESGNRWYLNTGNGFYGGMQFTVQSWHAVGGWGMPHQNTKLEQAYRAVKLLHIQGYGAWPVCGH